MSTKRDHRMPFGAELTADRQVRFRLWAPAARSVELMLYDTPEQPSALAMQPQPDGWFELVTPHAHAGSRYRFRIDGGAEVPDPASRSNPDDVHGASEVIDPASFTWTDSSWRGRPWHEAVVYELHVGTFSPEGTFAGVERRLDYLVELGITVIELMPVADFPGKRGWGYDGVLLYAPESTYGTPDDLKSLVDAAHRRGVAVLLDVVYNHFGPEGNYLHTYAPQFFTDRVHTPWGAGIDFQERAVRDFYRHNALYWLEEYHLDGLRFDAVHAIRDPSPTHILTEIARAVRGGPGSQRSIHLVLENGDNQASFLGTPGASDHFDAQWNDDIHHTFHTVLTGESDGYYCDFARNPHALLCRCLAEGFAYQGEMSDFHGCPRGERSAGLPPTAFVNFLQNHDQIGNRAFGERLSHLIPSENALRAATAVLLLAPSPPMLFMGEEWDAPEPFPYFCDFEPELAQKVRAGRRQEFARFERFRDPKALETLPDPVAETTFLGARLHWERLHETQHAGALRHHRRLLAIRHRDIVPLIPHVRSGNCITLDSSGAFAVDWQLTDGSVLHLLANLTKHPVPVVGKPAGRMIFTTHPNIRAALERNELAPWSVIWLLDRSRAKT